MRIIPFAITLSMGILLLGMSVQAAGPGSAKSGKPQTNPSAAHRGQATANRDRGRAPTVKRAAPVKRSTSGAAAGSKSQATTNPGRTRSAAVRRTQQGLQKRAQPQAGTGRLGRETTPANSAGNLKSRQGNAFGRSRSTRETAAGRNRRDASRVRQATAIELPKRTPAEKAERLLQLRLAKIDYLRDVALKNGNERLLQKADELEQLAHRQYDRRIAAINEINATESPESNDTDSSADSGRGIDVTPRAKSQGRAIGPLTSEEARRLRREFGKKTAERVRNAAANEEIPPSPPQANSESETNPGQ